MTHILLLSSLLGALTAGWLAQGAPQPTYTVPAIREPHHDVKLENRFVRVLDVTVPPYDSTLFHIHENPYVYVSIGPATLKAQVLGSNEFTDLNLKDGEVRYSPVVTHRVGNIASTPFRNITIQIQGRDDTTIGPSTAAASAKVTGSSSVLDNDLVHVDRLVLEPGQSTGLHTHTRSNLLVAVHQGSLRIESDGRPAMRLTMNTGDFDWHTGARSHSITNTGTMRFEAIEVIWK
jgi:quercetin dioxygenase-like cupin family protein